MARVPLGAILLLALFVLAPASAQVIWTPCKCLEGPFNGRLTGIWPKCRT
jgi:hypothetical protein